MESATEKIRDGTSVQISDGRMIFVRKVRWHAMQTLALAMGDLVKEVCLYADMEKQAALDLKDEDAEAILDLGRRLNLDGLKKFLARSQEVQQLLTPSAAPAKS